MSPEQLDRVFGRGRLQMRTGAHVEVFREAAAPGERRRYTKRFLATTEGDFRGWTEREWRLLARLVGHGVRRVPDVVQFDRGSGGGPALVQTFDAGITVDHWATLLPVEREGRRLRHVFEDAAHWWALAHHALIALEQIHRLQLVHLDLKADNVCIPFAPADFVPGRPGERLRPVFGELALIDFAFSLVSGEAPDMALPIGRQPDYAYQSPRLLRALEAGRAGDLRPTSELDWRCDLYSLAAMLERYLPPDGAGATDEGWRRDRLRHAQALLRRLREAHDRGDARQRPHPALIEFSAQPLHDRDLAASLEQGWTLALGAGAAGAEAAPTPVTRVAPPVPVRDGPGPRAATRSDSGPPPDPADRPAGPPDRARRRGPRLRRLLWPAIVVGTLAVVVPPALDAVRSVAEAGRTASAALRSILGLGSSGESPRETGPVARAPVETFEQRAQRLLRERVPELAARAERDVEPVLRAAARAEHGGQDADVLDAAREIRPASDSGLARGHAPADARRLNEEARRAFWTRRNVREAFGLQLRAFGAHPRDPEIVGNLAFLHLKQQPPRPEAARRLALYALALGGQQFPAGRSEDWGTLAVASALMGREREATHALYVMLASGRDLERACRAALGAVANHGEALRAPAEALLWRIRQRGEADGLPACRWPPDWQAGARFP